MMQNKIAIKALKDPIMLLATGFGSGLSPKAPGTAGTISAIPIYLLLRELTIDHYLLATALVTIFGILICDYAVRKIGEDDHPSIVIDEIAGFLITMMYAPVGLVWLVYGFVLFRLFDIIKPWPISWFDRHIKRGVGVMLDDIVAGIFAATVIYFTDYYQLL